MFFEFWINVKWLKIYFSERHRRQTKYMHQIYAPICLKDNPKVKVDSHNTSHKFWDQTPCLHYQCCLQVSKTVSWHKLWCCYPANILQHWVGRRGLIYFCKVNHSRISGIFSRNWLGLNNLCEILQICRHNFYGPSWF